ncbi:MAG: hypothetical protein EPO09_19905 [Aquabacterium sp.]|uniref:alpha/beta hydrolase domain-containing protein n=1 Tax=Aquabacterium sp. TaxID=1872578 RepID=UPI0011FC1EFD|nr:alpha/beta hydrolase domain-containing protein [Aquabacterium sp.]TAK86119.1 MAG: hypothetical protein EPO09_19905 [Aquabacterium sp.]
MYAALPARVARLLGQGLLGLALSTSLAYATTQEADKASAAVPAPIAAGTYTWQAADSGRPVSSRQAQLTADGYIEEEWRLRGQAQAYAKDGDWGDDGRWKLKLRGTTQAYDTRVLIRRPKDPARFNGIVLVEWLNTSLGFDIDGGWIATRDELLREGYAWAGVSAERASALSLKKANPQRYAQVNISDSDYSFDIYAHAASALRQSASQWGPASAPKVKLLGMGYSKSASFLFTFMNAFQPVNKAFDGYYLRGATPAAIQVNGWHINIVMPSVRRDLGVPLMQVQTEMEVGISWPLSKTKDTDMLRYWEIAAGTHLDQLMQDELLKSSQQDAHIPKPDCLGPSSPLQIELFDHAALHALRTWITDGTPPPTVARLQRTDIGFVKDDELGNPMGGLRLPDLDVPIARYGVFNNGPRNFWSFWATFACMSGGSVKPFDADTLRARYPSDQAYYQAYKQAADKLLQAGFLRPAGHAQLLNAAQAVRLPH